VDLFNLHCVRRQKSQLHVNDNHVLAFLPNRPLLGTSAYKACLLVAVACAFFIFPSLPNIAFHALYYLLLSLTLFFDLHLCITISFAASTYLQAIPENCLQPTRKCHVEEFCRTISGLNLKCDHQSLKHILFIRFQDIKSRASSCRESHGARNFIT